MEKNILGTLAVVGGAAATLYFVTRAKAKAKPPAPPPGEANLYGTVTDTKTGKKIKDVLVTLNGYSMLTNTVGYYQFTDLEPDSYTVGFSKEDYLNEGVLMTVLHEGNNELNVKLTPIPSLMANLYGIVTDAETNHPIAGVRVTIDGLVVYTSARGQYLFEGLEPGSYTITFEKEGYETAVY